MYILVMSNVEIRKCFYACILVVLMYNRSIRVRPMRLAKMSERGMKYYEYVPQSQPCNFMRIEAANCKP